MAGSFFCTLLRILFIFAADMSRKLIFMKCYNFKYLAIRLIRFTRLFNVLNV